MQKTHWKKLINPDYFGSYLFQPGEEKTLTIKDVRREMVTGADGKKEECTVIFWVENEKPLIMNSTNGKMISKIVGSPYTEDWHGKRIVLGVEKVKAFGEVVDAVRVKNKRPAQSVQDTPEFICIDCNQKVTDSGGFAAEKIVENARNRYGVILCMDCAMKRKKAKEATPDENNQNQDQ